MGTSPGMILSTDVCETLVVGYLLQCASNTDHRVMKLMLFYPAGLGQQTIM
jgi:hypothetical protein